jgi:hypothetical protein
VKVKPQLSFTQSVTGVSRATVAKANTIAPLAITAGRNQKLERTRSHVLNTCTLMMTLPHSFACPGPKKARLATCYALRVPIEKMRSVQTALIVICKRTTIWRSRGEALAGNLAAASFGVAKGKT